MYMFQAQGLICRKTVVTSMVIVQLTSTCMVHPGTSEYDYAEITIKGFIRYLYVLCFYWYI